VVAAHERNGLLSAVKNVFENIFYSAVKANFFARVTAIGEQH
jgi:hypothetical protein